MTAHQIAFINYEPPKLNQLPIRERPTERINHYGPAAVSMTELLAALVGGAQQLEIAHRLIVKFGDITGIARACTTELAQIKGMGQATAARVKAALELGRRLLIHSPEALPLITSPADAANLVLAEMSTLKKEQVRVLILNTRNRVIAQEVIYVGSSSTLLIRVAELFEPAIRHTACGIIVIHNHPSGDPTPSPEDVRLTETIVQAGKLLDIELLDHLIIGQGRFISLKERGLGFR